MDYSKSILQMSKFCSLGAKGIISPNIAYLYCWFTFSVPLEEE